LGKVYAAVAARGKLTADQTLAAREKWMTETTSYLTTQNLRREQHLAEMERQRRSNANALIEGSRRAPPVSSSR
ncbi:MAG: hypothetical protein ABWY27_01175, partial [Telluria sp.]